MRSVSTLRRLVSIRFSRKAGEAHPACGGPEQLRVGLRRDDAAAVGGGDQGDGLDRVAPRPRLVVVLAVDVRGDGAPDGDLTGAGGDGDEPAEGDEPAHQGIDAGAGLCGDDALLHVQAAQAGHPGGVHHQAAGVLRRVAVGAPEATGDDAALGCGLQHGGQLVLVGRPDDLCCGGRGVGPARELLGADLAHVAYTPTANTSSQVAPMIWRARSPRTTSSGAPPWPVSSRST